MVCEFVNGIGRSEPLAGGAYFSGKQSLGQRLLDNRYSTAHSQRLPRNQKPTKTNPSKTRKRHIQMASCSLKSLASSTGKFTTIRSNAI